MEEMAVLVVIRLPSTYHFKILFPLAYVLFTLVVWDKICHAKYLLQMLLVCVWRQVLSSAFLKYFLKPVKVFDSSSFKSGTFVVSIVWEDGSSCSLCGLGLHAAWEKLSCNCRKSLSVPKHAGCFLLFRKHIYWSPESLQNARRHLKNRNVLILKVEEASPLFEDSCNN